MTTSPWCICSVRLSAASRGRQDDCLAAGHFSSFAKQLLHDLGRWTGPIGPGAGEAAVDGSGVSQHPRLKADRGLNGDAILLPRFESASLGLFPLVNDLPFEPFAVCWATIVLCSALCAIAEHIVQELQLDGRY